MLRIGVLSPSEIAFRRFVPAVKKSKEIEYVGVACALKAEWKSASSDQSVIKTEYEKAEKFAKTFGGKVFEGYYSMLKSPEIDAVYVPLPPGLHYVWGNRVLDEKKHLMLEKPFCDSFERTKTLLSKAEKNDLAVHENFAFVYHNQVNSILEAVNSGTIGDVRLIRTAFGFPYRGENDFRYHKSSGGGALLDCGGYPVRLASLLLGNTSKVTTSALCTCRGHDVDVFGSASMQNKNGIVAQLSFGMDNAYKCELEIWGSKGILQTARVFTPTAEMETVISVSSLKNDIVIKPDDQFLNSVEFFLSCIKDSGIRRQRRAEILNQAQLMQEIWRLADEN